MAIKSLSRESEQILTVAQFLAMPAQPDGTIVYVLADAAAGVVWTLRFNAGSASPYKWELISGPSLMGEATAATPSISALTYVDVSGNPAIVAPLAGDYDVSHGAQLAATASGQTIYQSVAFPTAGDTEACSVGNQGTSGSGNYYSVTRDIRRTVAAAGTTVKIQHKAGSSGWSGNAASRWLKIIPVRVAGP